MQLVGWLHRIKQVDFDGKYSYSDVCSVVYEPRDNEVVMYPNPVGDYVKITTSYNTNLTITDLYGRIILTKTIIEGENTIDLEQLPNGFYIFALENGDRYKILKE